MVQVDGRVDRGEGLHRGGRRLAPEPRGGRIRREGERPRYALGVVRVRLQHALVARCDDGDGLETHARTVQGEVVARVIGGEHLVEEILGCLEVPAKA